MADNSKERDQNTTEKSDNKIYAALKELGYSDMIVIKILQAIQAS